MKHLRLNFLVLLAFSALFSCAFAQEPEFTHRDGVTLREYLEHRLDSSKEYYEVRFLAMEKAVSTAQSSLDKRLDAMNEFRSTLKDQNASFITRTEYTQMAKEVQDLRESRAILEGKASQNSVLVAYAMAGLGLLIGVIGLITKRGL